MSTITCAPPLGARRVVGIDLTAHFTDLAYSYATFGTMVPGYVLFVRVAGKWRWTWHSMSDPHYTYQTGETFASLAGAVTKARDLFRTGPHTDATRLCAHLRAMDAAQYTPVDSPRHHDQRCEAHR